MTRQELKDLMPDITDEQISAVLAKHHEEINAKTKAAEDKFSAYKDKADKYDKEQADKLSEQEKYQKLMEEATQIKAENTRLLNRTKVQEKFVKAGIKEECYSPLLDSIVSDDEGKSLAFADSLISSFSANAAAAAEAAIPPAPRNSTTRRCRTALSLTSSRLRTLFTAPGTFPQTNGGKHGNWHEL